MVAMVTKYNHSKLFYYLHFNKKCWLLRHYMHTSYKLVLLRDNLVGKCQFFVKLQTVPLCGCYGYKKETF